MSKITREPPTEQHLLRGRLLVRRWCVRETGRKWRGMTFTKWHIFNSERAANEFYEQRRPL